MGVPFFGSGTGDPRRFQRRIGVQAVGDVPGTLFYDFPSLGGPIAPDPQTVKRGVALSTPMAQPPLPGKVDLADMALAFGDVDPNQICQAMVYGNFFQRFDVTNSGAAYRYVFSQLGGTVYPKWLTVLNDNDTGLIGRVSSCLVKSLKLTAQAKANLAIEPTLVGGPTDYHADGTITGTGTTVPQLRGTSLLGAFVDEATDSDIYVKVTTAPSGGITGVKAKLASATSYAGAEILVADGVWTFLYGTIGATTNALMGTRGEQVQINIPAGNDLAINDVIRFNKRRGRWSATYLTARPIPEINLRVFLNNEEVQAEGGWVLTMTAPKAERLIAPGRRQPLRTRRLGEQTVELTASRQTVDLTFQRPLLRQDVVSFVIECISDIMIASTAVPYGDTFVLPYGLDSGAAYDIKAGADDRTEQHKFTFAQSPTGFVYNGVTYYADCTVIRDTGLTAIQ